VPEHVHPPLPMLGALCCARRPLMFSGSARGPSLEGAEKISHWVSADMMVTSAATACKCPVNA